MHSRLFACPLLFAAPAIAQSGSPFMFEVGSLTPSDVVPDQWIGEAVDTDGRRAVLSSSDDSFTDVTIGRAWIADRSEDGLWEVGQELVPDTDVKDARFGEAVAIDGDVAVVGAHHWSKLAPRSGAVFVFTFDAGNGWGLKQRLEPQNPSTNDYFGVSLALDGDRLLVGSMGQNYPGPGPESGVGIVYERDSQGQFVELARLEQELGDELRFLGQSAALRGDVAVLGSESTSPTTPSEGAVCTFVRGASGTWSSRTLLRPSDGVVGDKFGTAVATDGDHLAVGATQHVEGNQLGAVYVFENLGGNAWSETQQLLPPDEAPVGRFGFSVDMDDDVIVVGETGSAGPSPGGIAHVFRPAFGSFVHLNFVNGTGFEAADTAGWSVAIDDGWIFCGAPSASTSGIVHARYEHGATNLNAPLSYGSGTPGCDGTHRLTPTLPAIVPSLDHRITCDNAPPSSFGFLFASGGLDLFGSDPFGIGLQLHLNAVTGGFLIDFPMTSDAAGVGSASTPLPNVPALVGTTFFWQAIWPWATCQPSTLGLSSSRGLRLAVGAF